MTLEALCLHPMSDAPTAVSGGGVGGAQPGCLFTFHPAPLLPDVVTVSRAASRGSWHPGKSYPRASLPGAPTLLCPNLRLGGPSKGHPWEEWGSMGLCPPSSHPHQAAPSVPPMVREPGTPPKILGADTPTQRGAGSGTFPRAGSESAPGLGMACQPAGHFRELVKGSSATLAWKVEIKTH